MSREEELVEDVLSFAKNDIAASTMQRLGIEGKKVSILQPGQTTLAKMAEEFMTNGDIAEAVDIYSKLVAEDPEGSEFYNDLGVALSRLGQFGDAEEAFLKAIDVTPSWPAPHNNYGCELMKFRHYDAAVTQFKKAIELDSDYVPAYVNICAVLGTQKRLDEAYVYAKGLVLRQGFEPVMFALPQKVFLGQCDYDGVEEFGDIWEIIEANPDRDMSLNFLEFLVRADTPERIGKLVSAHKRWGKKVAAHVGQDPLPKISNTERTGRIRLGFVSSDLRDHAVAKFVLPIIEQYDRDKIEIFCYAPI
ncbi:MAG: tetratricopeptide repeat protein [Alphaproteobacteria bacterium]|nr:tetratricopeptide repeat protein [Alphaproteobacteria bacterium]